MGLFNVMSRLFGSANANDEDEVEWKRQLELAHARADEEFAEEKPTAPSVPSALPPTRFPKASMTTIEHADPWKDEKTRPCIAADWLLECCRTDD
jgi:hypothetical protein